MQILIVPDSFKGSLSAQRAAEAMCEGFARVFPDADYVLVPAADGGEGTVQAVTAGANGRLCRVKVSDPLGREIEAEYGLLPDGTAVMEMAQASGLPLLSENERNPALTSTYGTGEMIRAALDAGCRRILIGIGGSATNDGGAGMAAALGVRFLDGDGRTLPPGGAALAALERIDISGLDERLAECEILTACDVTNPLCGENGASCVFGPQKGASPDVVRELDRALMRYSEKLTECFGKDFADIPGAGAAGGLGAGLMAFVGAVLRPGTDIVFEVLDLETKLAQADLVVTGEGRIDASSACGKLLSGLGAMALRYGKPVIALTGMIGAGADALYGRGIRAFVPLCDRPMSPEESMSEAETHMKDAAERAARLIRIGRQLGGNEYEAI